MTDNAEDTATVIYSFPQASAPVGREAGSLHRELFEAVRELIVHGDLAPGSRVPERILCQRFGVSRTPLREALKVLAAEGLVTLLPNRGARVTAFDEGDLNDLFEVIGMLEAEAGRLACERMSDAAIAEVQALHYRMYAHFLREELPEYFQLKSSNPRRHSPRRRKPRSGQRTSAGRRADTAGALHVKPFGPRPLETGGGGTRSNSRSAGAPRRREPRGDSADASRQQARYHHGTYSPVGRGTRDRG